MLFQLSDPPRRFLIPEVIQTSGMDCGPAALKAILEGFGIPISYGRLREACQTDVDGTSIDTLEEVAGQLGLEAAQMLVPIDHLLLRESGSLPALVAVRQPNGFGHFVVAWSLHGPLVQVMDPAAGRRWSTRQHLLDEAFRFTHPVAMEDWRTWAGSEGFIAPLRSRLSQVHDAAPALDQLLDTALADISWFTLARLDAATRMTVALIEAGGIESGPQAWSILTDLFEQTSREQPGACITVPPRYWLVQPLEQDGALLRMQGVLIIRFFGVTAPATPLPTASTVEPAQVDTVDTEETEETAAPVPLSAELVAALNEPPEQPAWEMVRMVGADGLLNLVLVLVAVLLSAISLIVLEVLLRGMTDRFWSQLPLDLRAELLGAVLVFVVAFFLLDYFTDARTLRMGRNLETRFRLRFLEKIPRLNDRYFQSRLISDMIQRVHSLRQVRLLPMLAVEFLRVGGQLIVTTAALVGMHVAAMPLPILAAISSVVIAVLVQLPLIERDLRVRTHLGALSRFYLDTLLGMLPIRSHSAADAVRREHESLLVRWLQASNDFLSIFLAVYTLELLLMSGFTVAMVWMYLWTGGPASGLLLYVFWAISLPQLGRQLLLLLLQYPMQRNQVLRLLEPLRAPEERGAVHAEAVQEQPQPPSTRGSRISFEAVTVRASGHVILSDISLEIQAGEHLAIVGPSGAGKSSLVGLLLGWHRAASGQVLVDGEVLSDERLHQVRRETVWVDPAVQIWNRSLLENLRYGNDTSNPSTNDLPLDQADLWPVLRRLPDGLQTVLGEGGGLVSGGEGQRVRLGRAQGRSNPRLVILDEPFRGLDREQRRDLLARARAHWAEATLLFISHDIDESQHFERTIVIEAGQIVEDGSPALLRTRPDSRYRALRDADEQARHELWSDAIWQRYWLRDGHLAPRSPHPTDPQATGEQ